MSSIIQILLAIMLLATDAYAQSRDRDRNRGGDRNSGGGHSREERRQPERRQPERREERRQPERQPERRQPERREERRQPERREERRQPERRQPERRDDRRQTDRQRQNERQRSQPNRRYESQREVERNNRRLIERRRVDRRHQREVIRYYNQRNWGRHHLHVYTHFYHYSPVFWTYYYRPYRTHWYFTWGWYTAPWYIHWGWYYRPYPYYISPSYWVTDYLISEMLQDQYADGYADGYQDGVNARRTPIDDRTKEQLRRQVDQTVEHFKSDQQVALDIALQDPNYLFVVDNIVSVLSVDGTKCQLSGGDIIKTVVAPNQNTAAGRMVVITSKGDSCPAGTQVMISVEDLQEMINTFGEKVDDGLQEIQMVQGQP